VVAADDEGDEGYEQLEFEGADADYGKSEDYAAVIAKAYEAAVTDEERSELLGHVAKSAALAKAQADAAVQALAAQEDAETLNWCISKADEYGFAGNRTEMFGVCIAKMMTVLDDDELGLMGDIFKSFSDLIDMTNIGVESSGSSDVMDLVHSAAGDIVKSSEGALSPEQAMAAAFEANPELYALYLDEKGI
jgi:hypothetical protein